MKVKLLFIILILFLCGCSKNSSMTHEHCIRHGNAGEDIDVQLNYDIYYTGDILNKLESVEQVNTDKQDVLDLYENAYKEIHSRYKNLEYYTAIVEREENSVSSKITILYDKIDIDKLISIEGEEDNIFENNIPLVSKWKDLAKKLGASCSIAE